LPQPRVHAGAPRGPNALEVVEGPVVELQLALVDEHENGGGGERLGDAGGAGQGGGAAGGAGGGGGGGEAPGGKGGALLGDGQRAAGHAVPAEDERHGGVEGRPDRVGLARDRDARPLPAQQGGRGRAQRPHQGELTQQTSVRHRRRPPLDRAPYNDPA